MTSADAVLAQIDHAIDDWSVSDDAMRWTPEPAAGEPIWEEANPAPPPYRSGGMLPHGSRVYVAQSAEPITPSMRGWTELGATTDGATFTYTFQPPPTPDFSGAAEAFSRLRVAARRVGVELADWQVRVLAALGPGLAEAQRVTDEVTGPEMDPDKPARPLRRAYGLDAQQSPYGPQRRGRR